MRQQVIPARQDMPECLTIQEVDDHPKKERKQNMILLSFCITGKKEFIYKRRYGMQQHPAWEKIMLDEMKKPHLVKRWNKLTNKCP